MAEKRPVQTPEYWQRRLASAKDQRRALWDASDLSWDRMEADHRIILANTIQPQWSVLDVGCGYGRLLTLMPEDWHGDYLGVDVSLELIEMARKARPNRRFLVWDAGVPLAHRFDIAVCVMVRHMLRAHAGEDAWQKVVEAIKVSCNRLLCLEPQEVG